MAFKYRNIQNFIKQTMYPYIVNLALLCKDFFKKLDDTNIRIGLVETNISPDYNNASTTIGRDAAAGRLNIMQEIANLNDRALLIEKNIDPEYNDSSTADGRLAQSGNLSLTDRIKSLESGLSVVQSNIDPNYLNNQDALNGNLDLLGLINGLRTDLDALSGDTDWLKDIIYNINNTNLKYITETIPKPSTTNETALTGNSVALKIKNIYDKLVAHRNQIDTNSSNISALQSGSTDLYKLLYNNSSALRGYIDSSPISGTGRNITATLSSTVSLTGTSVATKLKSVADWLDKHQSILSDHDSRITSLGNNNANIYKLIYGTDETNKVYITSSPLTSSTIVYTGNTSQTITTTATGTNIATKINSLHALIHSTRTTVASGTKIGNVRLSDSVTETFGINDGVAATPKAVRSAYNLASSASTIVSSVSSVVSNISSAFSTHSNKLATVGTATSNIGHVKLQNVGNANYTDGYALTPKALYDHNAITATTAVAGHVKIVNAINNSGVNGVAAAPAAVSTLNTSITNVKTYASNVNTSLTNHINTSNNFHGITVAKTAPSTPAQKTGIHFQTV